MDDVDGRPRYDGLRSLVEARRIGPPWGDPPDAPGALTVCGLGNRKEEVFAEVVRREGVELFEGAMALLRALRAKAGPVRRGRPMAMLGPPAGTKAVHGLRRPRRASRTPLLMAAAWIGPPSVPALHLRRQARRARQAQASVSRS